MEALVADIPVDIDAAELTEEQKVLNKKVGVVWGRRGGGRLGGSCGDGGTGGLCAPPSYPDAATGGSDESFSLSDPHAPKSLFPPYTYTYPLPPSPPPPQAADTLKQQLEDLMKDRADLFDTMIESESKIRLDESGWKARCVAKCGECGEEWGSNICLSNYSMKQGGGDGEWGYSWSS